MVKKNISKCILLFILLATFIITAGCAVPKKAFSERDTLFDDGWRFYRGDAVGAEQPVFNDWAWRKINLPHDYSIEDLTLLEEKQQPSLSITEGIWRFSKGDDPNWKKPDFDDVDWQQVILPANWEEHSNYQDNNVYGWYRRKIIIPEEMKTKDILLEVGIIDDVDETYVNGVKVGGMGTFPPNYVTAWTVDRLYKVPADLLKGDGTDVVAVRVFDGDGNGGLYDKIVPQIRSGPFDSKSEGGASAGFTVGGIAWYRKTFTLPKSLEAKSISLIFGGIYMNAQIYLNGKLVGEHPYGYTTFSFDITPDVRFGNEKNILAVKVDTSGRHTRWYSGSGIYRHVWLRATEPVHIDNWGIFITTPKINSNSAAVKILTKLVNEKNIEQNVKLISRIIDARGYTVKKADIDAVISPDDSHQFEQSVTVYKPKLWSIETPYLYKLESNVEIDGKIVDTVDTIFGIRSIEISAEEGFKLNGKVIELKGGCVHHDNGCLGACAYDRAEERRVELLKANGFNAIRTSHNTPSQAFLDACDRFGMVVIDESFDCWNEGKNSSDYHLYFKDWWQRDIDSMVLRDRNHPCVIMWSIGNEVPNQTTPQGAQITGMLVDYVRKLDPTRPVTQAFAPAANWDDQFEAFDKLDAVGYNYKEYRYRTDHEKRPRQIMLSTESMPKELYKHWKSTVELPYVIGDFVWTAMDYLGEAGLGWARLEGEPDTSFKWPWTVANCGDLDLCGFKRPQSYFRDIVWGQRKIVLFVHEPKTEGKKELLSWWGWPKVFSSWTWPGQEGKMLDVYVYSACPKVRLMLNDQDLGIKEINDSSQLTGVWQVPYQPGKLEAVGLDKNGKEIAKSELLTADTPAAIRLSLDRIKLDAGKQDLCYVTVEILDEKGNLCPNADDLVHFQIDGPAKLIGICNGDPRSTESFQLPQRKAWHGRLLAVIKAGDNKGKVNLTASAEGLKTDTRELIIK